MNPLLYQLSYAAVSAIRVGDRADRRFKILIVRPAASAVQEVEDRAIARLGHRPIGPLRDGQFQ